MQTVHAYTVHSTWTGDRQSVGHMETDGFSTQFSIPSNLDGSGIGTNPEELLTAAAASCYLITLSSLLFNRGIAYVRLELTTTAEVCHDRGLRMDRLTHRPTIILDDASQAEHVMGLAEHAEHACMVSSAIRGNVSVTVIPSVQTQATTV